MNANPEDSEYNEFEGFFDSESSETANGSTPTVEDQFAALLESNRLLQQSILGQATRKQKVYIPMPEKFDGRVGDFIEAWLEQFETWFHHREQVEGVVKARTCIETVIQNTKTGIILDLTRHESDYGKWATWEDFADHIVVRKTVIRFPPLKSRL